jgi:hypothetical protein
MSGPMSGFMVFAYEFRDSPRAEELRRCGLRAQLNEEMGAGWQGLTVEEKIGYQHRGTGEYLASSWGGGPAARSVAQPKMQPAAHPETMTVGGAALRAEATAQPGARPGAQPGAQSGAQPGGQPKAQPAAQLTAGPAGADAWRTAAGEQGAPPTADPTQEGSAQQQHRGQRSMGQQESSAQMQPQAQRRTEQREDPAQQQPQGQRHKEQQARRVSDLHSHGGFPPSEGRAAQTAAQQQARPNAGAPCIKRAERWGPAAACPKQQKRAGALIAAVLMCCVLGSELLVSTPVEHGTWNEEGKRGPKTSIRRRCRGPGKERRRATKARVQRGRKSQLLPD